MSEPTACIECLRRAWLLAALAPYIERGVNLAEINESTADLLRLSNEDLTQAVAPKVAAQLLARIDAFSEEWLLEELQTACCWACCRHSSTYPQSLKEALYQPWALFGRGDKGLLETIEPARAVTIVGSRRATSYGREVARQMAHELAAAGIIVISGLAFGIDGCAHRGALDAGQTIGVLACGPDIAYPFSHRSLWRRISEQGTVISELPPGAAPWRWTFPARNRIMAGLAGMTIVVEAAPRSDSLITAEFARNAGSLVGAVPGPVTSRTSAGPNALLLEGARVVRDARDVLDLFGARHEDIAPEAGARGGER